MCYKKNNNEFKNIDLLRKIFSNDSYLSDVTTKNQKLLV